jgi:hypothetical protein
VPQRIIGALVQAASTRHFHATYMRGFFTPTAAGGDRHDSCGVFIAVLQAYPRSGPLGRTTGVLL